jgi:hypothetical protein
MKRSNVWNIEEETAVKPCAAQTQEGENVDMWLVFAWLGWFHACVPFVVLLGVSRAVASDVKDKRTLDPARCFRKSSLHVSIHIDVRNMYDGRDLVHHHELDSELIADLC